MWTLYLTASHSRTRPSDLVCIQDDWAALQFDNAVAMVGRIIENAAQEQHNVGSEEKPKFVNKYKIGELLDDDFRFAVEPEPTERDKQMKAWNVLKGWARTTRGVRYIQQQ